MISEGIESIRAWHGKQRPKASLVWVRRLEHNFKDMARTGFASRPKRAVMHYWMHQDHHSCVIGMKGGKEVSQRQAGPPS